MTLTDQEQIELAGWLGRMKRVITKGHEYYAALFAVRLVRLARPIIKRAGWRYNIFGDRI